MKRIHGGALALALAGCLASAGCEEMVALADGMLEGCSYTQDFCGTTPSSSTYLPPAPTYPTSSPRIASVGNTPPPALDTGPKMRPSANACISLNGPNENAGFHNSCSFPVSLHYCVTGARSNSFSSTMTCPNGGMTGIAANGFTTALVGGGSQQVFFFACDKRYDIKNVRWTSASQGYTGMCTE